MYIICIIYKVHKLPRDRKQWVIVPPTNEVVLVLSKVKAGLLIFYYGKIE